MKKGVLTLILLFHGLSSWTWADGIRFYGDVLLSRGIATYVKDQGKDPIQKALAPFLSRDAIHVMNFEGSVGTPDECIGHHNPCFPVEPELLDLITGCDVATLQNNHSLDLGPKGLSRSVRELKKRTIKALGGRVFSTVIETNDGNMGIVAVTDVVNSPSDRSYVTLADSPEVLTEIRRLKTICTAVAVYAHWGRELVPVPTDRMRMLAGSYIKAGADVITGCHPHVVSSAAVIDGKPVVWSLGNFLFDQKYEETKKGAVLNVTINEDSRLALSLTSHETPRNSYLPVMSNQEDAVMEQNKVLSSAIPPVDRTWTGRFTHDRREKKLTLKKDGKQNGFYVLELSDLSTGKTEARSLPMPVKRLQPVDLNGDGVNEIMLLLNIYADFDHETAKRVYLYSFDKVFHALWRGTALSRPLIDAAFVKNKNGKPVLAALHSADSFLLRKPGTPERLVTLYKWNGFGFSGIRETRAANGCDAVTFSHGKIRLTTRGFITSEMLVDP